jgi:L-rhamnose mutarotase
METVALHTRLAPGREADYERIHAVIPPELDTALRAAGVHNWRIWRSGRELFHLVECEDYTRMRAFLQKHPANIPWQERMGELLEVTDDYSGDDRGIGLVWALPAAPAQIAEEARDEAGERAWQEAGEQA